MKKLIATTIAATIVLSSTVYASDSLIVEQKGVDVVAAATNEAPKPAPAPAPKPTPAPAPKPAPAPAPKPAPAPAPKPAPAPAPKPAPAPAPKPAPAPAPKPAPAPAPTPAPAPAPTTTDAVTTSRLLRVGTKGDDVKLLQTQLTANGYTLKVDGFFGKKTSSAVKKFQGKNGLKADGIVGPKTLAKLIELSPAQKLTITSSNTSIENRNFKGDIYVRAANFKLVGAKVDGNVFFVTQEAKDTFKMTNSTITGKQILADIDAVSTASIVNDAAALEKAIGKDGNWIATILTDMTINTELVVDGEFHDKGDATKPLKRKIGLYTHNDPADKKKATHSFTLTAPKLTVKSPSTTLQYGTFVGDIYVRANNFNLTNIKVDGNVYFTTQEAKDTFTMTNSTITGKQILADIDAVSTASIVNDAAALEKAIGKDGNWIATILTDMTISKELVVDGEFHDKGDVTKPLKRKIGLYTHNDPADKKKATHSFTLTAPKLTVKSPSTTLQYGTFVGDIYVRANNFNLTNIKVDGNVYFTTQEAKDTFTMANSTITGKQILADVDAVSTASIVNDAAAFEKAIGKDGNWIATILTDMTINKGLVVDGEFHDKGDATKPLKRKIGLYTHNDPADKKKATHSFTLTAPKLTVKSPSTTLQYGTFVGDIYVRANNFNLTNIKVDGNIYFTTQEAKDTFTMTNSEVTGKQLVILN